MTALPAGPARVMPDYATCERLKGCIGDAWCHYCGRDIPSPPAQREPHSDTPVPLLQRRHAPPPWRLFLPRSG